MWISWLDVGVVDPGSYSVDLESSGRGQDHNVGSFPARLERLLLVPPHAHPIAWSILMGVRRRPGLVEGPQLRPHPLMGSLPSALAAGSFRSSLRRQVTKGNLRRDFLRPGNRDNFS